MFCASAYNVEDLVVDNGYYVIENLYWSRADQYPNRYQPAEYQYPKPVLGLSKCLEFNYVKSAAGVVVPYYVQATGLTVFSGANQITKNWNFKFANSSDITDIETDAPGIYLPNDQYVPSNRNTFTYSGGCSTDGSSLIQAMHGYSDDEIIESFYNAGIGQITTFYILYNYYNGRPQRPYLDTWAGEITPTSDGLRIDFGSAIYWPRSTASYTLLSSSMMSYINSTEENIIHRMELEVFKPTGFFDCKEYAFNRGSNTYSTSGVDRHIPLRVKPTRTARLPSST